MRSRPTDSAEKPRSRGGAHPDLYRSVLAAIPRLLPDFLRTQRWFGGKGRLIARAGLEDIGWLRAQEPAGLAIVRVEYREGAAERYMMLVGFSQRSDAPHRLGACDGPPDRPWLVECSGDPAIAASFLRGFCDGEGIETERGGSIRYGDMDRDTDRALSPDVVERSDVRLLGAEQSNTTFRAGPRHVFKLFRRIEEGENPEAEITRFLTRGKRFPWSPALRGTISYERAGSDAGTVGVLEDWVPNHGDGWTHVVRTLEEARTGPEAAASLTRDLHRLGGITAEFHEALASARNEPEFAPEPISDASRSEVFTSTRARAARLLERLRRSIPNLAPARRLVAQELVDAADRLRGFAPPEITHADRRFHRIRIHGDYHLGQTLKTQRGFAIIDFEGEPACPLAERRIKQCALKDVAGMLRSFDYATETVSRSVAAHTDSARVGVPPVTLRDMRRAYLDGYEERVGATAKFAPLDREARVGWLRFFEFAKALYEVEYEMDNRPDWIDIPLRGIHRLLRPADGPPGAAP